MISEYGRPKPLAVRRSNQHEHAIAQRSNRRRASPPQTHRLANTSQPPGRLKKPATVAKICQAIQAPEQQRRRYNMSLKVVARLADFRNVLEYLASLSQPEALPVDKLAI